MNRTKPNGTYSSDPAIDAAILAALAALKAGRQMPAPTHADLVRALTPAARAEKD